MKKFKIIIIAVVSILALIIFLQNTEVVETHILFATVSMSRALLLILIFTAGFVAGLIGGYFMRKSKPSGDAKPRS